MTWAIWLAIPVVATIVASIATWWWARRSRPPRRIGVDEAMRAHRDYLDALVVPARGAARVRPGDRD